MAQALTRNEGERLQQLGNGRTETELPLLEPRADVLETGDAFLVQVDMPAVASEDVDVTVERNVLTVRGEAGQIDPGGLEPVHEEFLSGGRFERTFRLSEGIDSDRIEARHSDGLLTLVLPKSETARARRIAVNAR